jgi:hypothetical protein
MKNSLCLGVLAVTCLGLGAVNAQPPAILAPTNTGPSGVMPSVPFPAPPGQGAPASQGGINEYLAYPRPTGSTGVGNDGPIGNEVYLRSGATINLGGTGIFGRVMDTGFEVQGGVRSIFFRPEPTTAWTVDVGLSTVFYHNRINESATLRNFRSTSTVLGQTVTTVIPQFPVTPTNLNQTSVRLLLGQEYFLLGSDGDPADGFWKWRAGWDAGGALGTSKVDLKEIRHQNDMVSSAIVAAHTDIEIPYGHCLFQAGFRAEYRYTWSDILQPQNNTDLSTLSLMFSTGVRF